MIKFYNINNVKDININYPDIYFTPEYGIACEYSDNSEWELCIFKDLLYVYLKKPFIYKNDIYYDLLTPYGYGGIHFKMNETYYEFIEKFKIYAYKKNYLTEVIRQNPYINIYLSYDKIKTKTTFGVNLINLTLEKYLNNTHKDNKRGYKISNKNNLKFKMENLNEKNISDFINIYNKTMSNLHSEKYYYFNEKYFNSLIKMNKYIFLASVYFKENIIACCIIFKYKKYIHYHLGGSLIEFRKLRPNNFIHIKIIEYGINNNYELYHLGGGLKDNDDLYMFKKKIANVNFLYTIYKNVLNNNIYNDISKIYKQVDYFPIHRK